MGPRQGCTGLLHKSARPRGILRAGGRDKLAFHSNNKCMSSSTCLESPGPDLYRQVGEKIMVNVSLIWAGHVQGLIHRRAVEHQRIPSSKSPFPRTVARLMLST